MAQYFGENLLCNNAFQNFKITKLEHVFGQILDCYIGVCCVIKLNYFSAISIVCSLVDM